MTKTSAATAAAKFYRTAKGTHVHADFECANQRRAIESGLPTECAADAMTPCEHCMPTGMVREAAAKAAAAADALCANTGVRNMKFIESECGVCGKRGRVKDGRLRAHKPKN